MFTVYDLRHGDEVGGYDEIVVYNIKEVDNFIYFLIYDKYENQWRYSLSYNFKPIDYGCDPAYYGEYY